MDTFYIVTQAYVGGCVSVLGLLQQSTPAWVAAAIILRFRRLGVQGQALAGLTASKAPVLACRCPFWLCVHSVFPVDGKGPRANLASSGEACMAALRTQYTQRMV